MYGNCALSQGVGDGEDLTTVNREGYRMNQLNKLDVEEMKMSAKEVIHGALLLVRLFALYAVLFVVEIVALVVFSRQMPLMLIALLIVNVLFIFKVMNYGFRKLRDDHKLERIFSLIYGVACYLCLIVQFAVLFYIFYVSVDGGGVIPKEVMASLAKMENMDNSPQMLKQYLSPIYTHVFPGFYKFPSNPGFYSIIQYYVGKFTDLFVLAYIVEAIRKRTGLK